MAFPIFPVVMSNKAKEVINRGLWYVDVFVTKKHEFWNFKPT